MILALLLFTPFLGDMQAAREAGKSFGESSKAQALSATKKTYQDTTFDPDQVSENNEITQYLLSEEVQANKERINPDEHYITQSDEIANHPDRRVEIESDSLIKTCHQSDAPFPKSVIRDKATIFL